MNEGLSDSAVLIGITRRWNKPAAHADLRSYLVQIYPVSVNYGLVELAGAQMVLGREAACDMIIVDDAVSRRHAVIEQAEEGFRVVDLGSTNGTFINDVRISEHLLAAGDRIRLGSHIFKFLADDQIEAQYHECVYSMATRDGLTAAFNKRYLLDALEREILQSQRHRRPLSLLMLDVDHFKAINDAHGHLAGDEVLIELVRRLRDTMRRAEILARYGGEEFAVVLSETGLADAQIFAQRLRSTIAVTPLSTSHGDIPVTISLGIAAMEAGESPTAGDLIAKADRNLYAAKAAGRNRVVG